LIAGARERFIERGSFPLVSGPGVIALCEDKLGVRIASSLTVASGAENVGLSLAEAHMALDSGPVSSPVVVKPRFGWTSIGFEEASDAREAGARVRTCGDAAPRCCSRARRT
jgi:hypothetical protein